MINLSAQFPMEELKNEVWQPVPVIAVNSLMDLDQT